MSQMARPRSGLLAVARALLYLARRPTPACAAPCSQAQTKVKVKPERREMPERYVTLTGGRFFIYASLGERKQSSPRAALFTWSLCDIMHALRDNYDFGATTRKKLRNVG